MNANPGTPEIKTDKRPLTSEILRARGGGCGVSVTRDPSESFPYDEGGAGHSGPKSKGSGSLSWPVKCIGVQVKRFITSVRGVVLQLARRKG
jgi:hypothetical protein